MSYFANQQIADFDAHTSDDDIYDRYDYGRPMNRAGVFAQLEAQRYQAAQAARPVLTEAERAASLYHAMCAAKAAGDLATARTLAAQLQPLVQFLPND